eukprot:tig00020610_g12061.t1
MAPNPPADLSRPIAIIVHGGAYAIPEEIADASVRGCEAAAKAGHQVLARGGSAMDAVEAAIRVLEDDPTFDAGTGSVLNEEGQVEMDAIVMDGATLKTGAVAAVQNIRNPVSLARQVMEQTRHCLLVGAGANKFAREMGVESVRPEELVTEAAQLEWKRFQEYRATVSTLFNRHELKRGSTDTVGCVALDARGDIACGTSTGGITAKKAGRVGDSPLVGCGAYADNASGGVSCTGHGESIMKVTLARQVLHGVEAGLAPEAAARKALEAMRARVDGCGGCIVLTPDGTLGHAFTTPRMAWAAVSAEGALLSGLDS